MLKEQYFTIGSLRLNYAEGPAAGPPMLLLHGGSNRWQSFEQVIPELAQHWHLYALDLRGHGKSGWTPGHYRLEDYTADVVAFLAGGVGATATLFGHSLGGAVALMTAAAHPDLVRAVIVGDAPLELSTLKEHLIRQREMILFWQALAGSGQPVEVIAANLRETPILVAGQAQPIPAREFFGEAHEWYQFMAENLIGHDPTMLTGMLDEADLIFGGYDLELLLPRIACPVLVLQAARPRGA